MKTKDNPVVAQLKPLAGKATNVTDDMVRRVIATAKHVSYEPHPKRKQAISIAKVMAPILAIGVFLDRKFSNR